MKPEYSAEKLPWLAEAGGPADIDVRIAATYLLLCIAYADGEYVLEEKNELLQALQKHFLLSAECATELEEIACELKQGPEHSAHFISRLNSTLNPQQKLTVMSLAWKVILADHELRPYETHLATLLGQSLGLSIEQAVLARKQAECGQV